MTTKPKAPATIFGGDRSKLGEYIRHMADLMGLRDWTVDLMGGNPPDDSSHPTEAQVTYGRKCLAVWVQDGWEHWPADHVRQTTTHELLHAHLNPLAHGILNNLADTIGKMVYDPSWTAMTENLKLTTDGIWYPSECFRSRWIGCATSE